MLHSLIVSLALILTLAPWRAAASPPAADAELQVFLSFSEVRPALGQDVDIRILVLNSGDAAAADVSVEILSEFAGSLAFGDFSADFGTFDENSLTWTIGNIGPGQSREGILSGTWTGVHAVDVFTAQVEGSPDVFSRRGIVQADHGTDAGFALSLDGNDDFVEVPDANALDVTDNFTLAAWVKPSAGASGHILSHDAIGSDTDGAFNVSVAGTTLSYETNNQGGLSASDALDAGEWNHVAITRSSAGSPNTRLYVNGALVALADVQAPSAVSAPVLIGRRGLADSFLEGLVDEVTVWNVALGQGDILSRMVTPLTGAETGLVAYWRFDENGATGTTALDATGNGHDGTLQNGAAWSVSTVPMKGAPRLDISITSNVTRAASGEDVTFDVRVTNEGPAVTGLQLDHFLRRGSADFVSATPNRGTHDVAMSRWSLETLPGGASETMELVLTSREASSLLVLGVDATTAHQRRTGGNPLAGTFTAFQTILPVQSAETSVLSLGGGGQFLRVPFAEEMNAPEAFSAAAWVNVTTPGSVGLFTRAEPGNASGGDYGINILSDGRVEWDVQSFGFVTTGAGAVSRNQWHHVAVVWDDTAVEADGKLRIYIDGNLALAANDGAGGGSLQPTTSERDLLIGSRAADLFLTGMIDDFTLWNRAISEEDVQDTMTGGLLGNEDGLVLLHRYEIERNLGVNNDGSDDAQDHSGHDLHGDLVGGATFAAATVPKRQSTVLASDDLQEDRIRVTWTLPEGETATLVQVLRNGQLLDVVSSQNEEYEDAGGRPNEIHVYCVVTEDGGGERSVLGCDGGRRRLFKPGDLVASKELFTDRVQVLWDDLSVFNTGYNVYRDGALVASLGGNTEVFEDTAVDPMVDHEYCVVPTQDGHEGNEAVCATGRRANVLPPVQVAATDGTIPAAVRISWVDQGEGATGFEVRRDGALLSSVGPDVFSFDDTSPISGTLHSYCVRRLVGPNASIDICDEGSINTLAPPSQVTASVNSFDDRIRVEWRDNTDHESGYTVYRKGGSALVFDGTDDVVEIVADATFDRPDMTFEAWLKPAAFGSIRSVIQKGDPRNFDVLLLENGTLHFAAHSVTCAELQVLNSAAPLPLDAWSHVAVSVSGSSATLYINGIESATKALAGVCTTSQPVRLGGGRFASFEGTMDEVRLWSGARSRAQVRASMHRRLGGTEDSLLAYWPLDSGTGTAASDAFSIHNGTLVGFDLSDAVPGWTSETGPFTQFGTGLAAQFAVDGGLEMGAGVVVDHAPALSLQEFTVETWMKPDVLIDEQLVLGKLDPAGGEIAAANYALVRMPNSHIRLLMSPEVCSEPLLPIVESTFPVAPGRWTHVAATYDGTTARLFINGVLNRERELDAPLCQNTDDLLLGTTYAGSLDRTRLWNEARSADDIASAMHQSVEAGTGGLVAAITYDSVLGSGDGVAGFNELAVTGLAANARMLGEPALIQGLPALQAATNTDRDDYVDVFADPGVSYMYCIAAFTREGVETETRCASGRRANALGADTVVATDRAFEDRVDVSWTSTSTRTSVFKVYRDDTLLATLPLTTLSYTDKGIPSDTDLDYCVTSVSAEGVESPRVCDVGSRSIKVPTDVQASNGEFEGRVDITWVDNSEIERGYRVYRREVLNNTTGELAADSSLVQETVASQAEATDRGGVPGTRYRYSVVAFDRDGFSRIGSAVGMRRLMTPASVAATDAETETFIRVTWDDRSRIERGYRVYRDGVEIATVDKNVTSYVDEGPPFGVEVTYAIEAFDDLGPSARGSDTGSTTLLPPGTVSASDSWADRVSITWVDQSAVESGYRIFRNSTAIADVASNVTSFEDQSAPGGTQTYCVATLSEGVESAQQCDTGFVFTPEAPPEFIPLDHSLVAADGKAPDEFGITVSIAGSQMMIGAWFQDSFKGSVYVYERQTSGWVFTQKLIASDSKQDAEFGGAISMTSSWAIIGSRRHTNTIGDSRHGDPDNLVFSQYGRAYFFKRTPDGWEEVQALTHDFLHPNARFGDAVSTDGNFALITAPGDNLDGPFGQGSVYIYKRDGDTWKSAESIGNTGVKRGAIDGDRAVFASSFDNQRGVFTLVKRSGDSWNSGGENEGPISEAEGGNSFGAQVDVSRDLVAVSADRADEQGLDESGVVFVYRMISENNFELFQRIAPDEHQAGLAFGKSLALDGDRLLVGANNQAYLFEKEGDGPFEQVAIYRGTGATPDFGRQVALSPAGDILVGDPAGFGNPERGRVFFDEVDPIEPGNVAATNGKFQNRVEITWDDLSDNEDGFRIFRDGELVDVTGADVTSYSDENAVPGNVHEYCVQSLRAVYEDVSEQICDIGWRFPDGAIAGKVSNNLAAAAQNIEVCLDPTPNGSLSLDGFQGEARSQDTTALPSSFTLEFWVKRSDGATGKDIAFSHGVPGHNTGLLAGFRENDTFTFGFFLNDLNGPQITDVKWHHFALTYDAGSGRRAIIHNGVEVASDNSSSYEGDGPFYLGTQHGGDHFNGQIDEVRIWNHVVPLDIINARMDETINPRLPDLGLFAHWALDERDGEYAANDVDTSGSFYLHHNGGAHPARPGAPLRACDITDVSGDYSFTGIRYGESTEFTVTPQDPGDVVRTFSPTRRLLTLNRQNPVQNEVPFTDITRYNIAGVVQFDGTECPVTDVLFEVRAGSSQNSGPFQSDEDGDYSVAADPGNVTVTPSVNGDPTRIFNPDILSFPDLDGDVFEQNLVDLTTRTLSGQVVGTGMCRLPIGRATLEIRAQNGCLTREVVTDDDGNYSVELPPMKYTVQMKSIANDNAVQRVDIEEFFEEQGAQIVDLTTESTKHDLIYRPGLRVQIAGLEPSMCNTSQIPDNTPIFAKGDKVDLSITVVEDLGASGVCPVDEGTVTLFSEISDQTNDPMTFELTEDSGGRVDTTIVVGQPNVLRGRVVDGEDRTFQKFITASADVDGALGESTEWAFVEGVRSRPGGRFATAPNTPTPLWVLRDPPGDGSRAFITEGSETCRTFSGSASFGGSVLVEVDLDLGVVADVGVAFGGEATVEAELVQTVGGSVKFELKQTLGGATELCSTVESEISTSTDEDFTGPDADLFVGAGLNYIFAKADKVIIDEDECTVELDDIIAFGPELETGFIFTREHIENRIIADLDELSRADETDQDLATEFQAAITNWNRMLESSTKTLESDDLEPFESDQRNRSFSAGAEFSFAKSASTGQSFFTETEFTVTQSVWTEIRAGAAGNIGGIKLTGEAFVNGRFNFETVTTKGTSYGYEFSDDDVGDNYTVDILEDPTFKTPTFEVMAGLSSCPYEPWLGLPLVTAGDASPTEIAPRMTPRDLPELSMNPIQRLGLDPASPALFTVNLGNASASDETRNYRLGMLPTSNPGGAILEAAGERLGKIDFTIPPGEVHQTGLAVRRGPEKFNYPRLGLVMYPICEEGNTVRGTPVTADTLFFDVSFRPPCSDISIFRPKENWTLNRETVGDPMEIILNDFTLAENDVDAGVQRIGFEYRRIGTSDWLPGDSFGRADIIAQGGPGADSFIANWTFPAEDGLYEIRAWTECDSGRNFSEVVVGRVDTVLPEVLKTPSPADGVLHFGDDIAAEFTEPMLCSSVITGGQNPNTTLRRLDTDALIPIGATCDGRTVVLSPQDATALDDLEGVTLQVTMEEWTDLGGNAIENPVSWQFDVQRSAFIWSPTAVSTTLEVGTTGAFVATLTNGEPTDGVDFTLASDSDWLVPNVTNGSIPAQSQATIDFTVQNLTAVGEHTGRVTATSSTGDESVLVVTATAFDECDVPVWDVNPADFQHNMTLTAQLFVSGVVSTDEQDMVAAFVNGQIRGVAPITAIDADGNEEPDGNRVNMVIYSNQESGEQVTFSTFDASQCDVHTTSSLTLTFDASAVNGTPEQPVTLQAPRPDAVPGDVALSSGWTWFSINVVPPDPRVSSILANVPATEANVIKSQRFFSLFDPTAGWVGTLGDLDPREGYLIRLDQSHNLGLVGTPVDVATMPIDLVSGWNWIGYMPQNALGVNEALDALTPATNDIIKSQFEFAQFVSGSGWIGSLTQMEPGLGYQIRMAQDDVLTYPDAGPPPALALGSDGEGSEGAATLRASAKRVDEGPQREEIDDIVARQAPAGDDIPVRFRFSEGLECSLNPGDFQFSLTLTAVVLVDGQEVQGGDLEVGAFRNETDSDGNVTASECRGLGRLQYVESLDRWLAFVVVYANEDGEPIDVKVFDPVTERVLDSDKVISFASNAVFGTVQHPIEIGATTALSTATEDQAVPRTFSLEANYPNPFSDITTIRYDVPRTEDVRVTVYDVLGRRVALLVSSERAAGRYEVRFDARDLAPGMYAYRMEAGSFVDTKFMILAR